MRTGGRGVLRGLVADIQPLWQNALTTTLTRLGFGSVAVCDPSDDLLQMVETTQPHLVVIDPDGFPDAWAVQGLVVVISARAEALTARATAVVSKRGTSSEIERSLRTVVAEHIEWATLTRRELEIIRLVAQGMSNRVIGATLWLSDQTVKFHLAQAYRKLGVCDRRAAVERVRELGLLLDDARPHVIEELVDSVRTVVVSEHL